MVEGISDLPTVLTIAHRFDTLAEAQDLLDESGPFAQLFVWPPFYVISVLGIIVGMRTTQGGFLRPTRRRRATYRSRRSCGSTRRATHLPQKLFAAAGATAGGAWSRIV